MKKAANVTNGEAEAAPATTEASTEQSAEKKKRRPRKPRQPRSQADRVLSKTTLFVANLPFSVDDAALADVFSGVEGFVSARVVRTRNDRSRGYGFVEFTNEEQQQKALAEKQGFKLTGHNSVERAISISVSSSAPEKPATEGEEQQ